MFEEISFTEEKLKYSGFILRNVKKNQWLNLKTFQRDRK